MRETFLLGLVVASASLTGACQRPPTEETTAPAASAPRPTAATVAPLASLLPPPPPPPPPAPAPAEVVALDVPGDRAASMVRSADGGPPGTVFLPGICSNANAYLHGFPEAARKHGGVVAIEGDAPCGADPRFRSFTWDAEKVNVRIGRALSAAGVVAASAEGLTLIGYSQGAALGEKLAARWPDRYARVVVIGAPKDPAASSFARSRGVVTMSCSRDVPARMRDASKRIAQRGVPSTYLEMPGCTHGNLADGERVFDEAFAFLRTASAP
jgi:pimeloyl-ACP methyl ester carboxylesterase